MTVFALGITRSLEWFEVHFLRWRRPAHLELEDESDEELKVASALVPESTSTEGPGRPTSRQKAGAYASLPSPGANRRQWVNNSSDRPVRQMERNNEKRSR
jgi:hypothetical protein